jgi:hypothetical protein
VKAEESKGYEAYEMQCEDCGRRAEAGRSEGWVAVRLESDRGVEVLTYCAACATQFESDDFAPIEVEGRNLSTN